MSKEETHVENENRGDMASQSETLENSVEKAVARHQELIAGETPNFYLVYKNMDILKEGGPKAIDVLGEKFQAGQIDVDTFFDFSWELGKPDNLNTYLALLNTRQTDAERQLLLKLVGKALAEYHQQEHGDVLEESAIAAVSTLVAGYEGYSPAIRTYAAQAIVEGLGDEIERVIPPMLELYQGDPQIKQALEKDISLARFGTYFEGRTIDYLPITRATVLAATRRIYGEDKLSPKEQEEAFYKRFNALAQESVWQAYGEDMMNRLVYETILTNPDIGVESLMALLEEKAKVFRFSMEQLRAYEHIINEYTQKHRTVLQVREQHPDDTELFEACFLKAPQGKVKVLVGPMTLDFVCEDIRDYAQAYGRPGNRDLKKEEIARANMSGGAALSTVALPELTGVVTIANGPMDERSLEAVIKHERQHQFNKLLVQYHETPYQRLLNQYETIATRIAEAPDPRDEAKRLVRLLATVERTRLGVDSMAWEEILAYYGEGTRSISQIFKLLAHDPLYNPAYTHRSEIETSAQKVKQEFETLMDTCFPSTYENTDDFEQESQERQRPFSETVTDKLTRKYMEEELTTSFRKDLKQWLGCIETLEKKGYSKRTILYQLSRRHIREWEVYALQAEDFNGSFDLERPERVVSQPQRVQPNS